MKALLVAFLFVIGNSVYSQNRIPLPDEKPLTQGKKSEVVSTLDEENILKSSCPFDINEFTGQFNFFDVNAPSEDTKVTISIDPETENGLIIDGIWGLSIQPEPIKIVLYPNTQIISWDEQLLSEDCWSYGPGHIYFDYGSFDQCELTISMIINPCVDLGCFGDQPIRFEKIRETDPPKECFWIGGSGMWEDLNNWATTSGGSTILSILPDEDDNVYFDENSFSSDGDSVSGSFVFCDNFSFLSSRKAAFNIGNLDIGSDFTINDNFEPNIYSMVFNSTGEVNFQTYSKPYNNITFQGTGSINFIDELEANDLTFKSGSVTMSKSVKCERLEAEAGVSNFNITAAYIEAGVFANSVDPAFFTADLSTLNSRWISSTYNVYNKIIIDTTYGYIQSSLETDSLILKGVNNLYLNNSIRLTVDYLEANGSAEEYLNVKGDPEASFYKSSGEVHTEYVIYDNVSATGGAIFYADNCIAKGNSTGWTGIGKYQVIECDVMNNIPMMDTVVLINASASSGLPLEYELVAGDGTLDGNEFTPSGTGQVEIMITQPGAVTDTAIYGPAFDANNTSEFGVTIFFQIYDENRPFALYNHKDACMVLGQDDFTNIDKGIDSIHFTDSYSVAVSSKDVLAANVSDVNNMGMGGGGAGRILIWKTLPTENGQPADIVLGRTGFNSSECGQTDVLMSLSRGLAFSDDGEKLIVSDRDRLLIWNSIPDTSGTPADVIIGTPGAPISGNTFTWLQGVLTTPDGKLIIGDDNRLLIFNEIPTSDTATADVVVFQADFTSKEYGLSAKRNNSFVRQLALSPDGRLFVSVPNDHRVLVFNEVPTENDTPADYVVGQDDLISIDYNREMSKRIGPDGLTIRSDGVTVVGGGRYSVPSSIESSGRLLIFKDIPTETGQLPDLVLGQPDLGDIYPEPISARSFSGHSEGMCFDKHGRLYVAQRGEGRILVFDLKDVNYIEIAEEEVTLQTTVVENGDTISIEVPVTIFTDAGLEGVITYTATLLNGDPLPDWIIFDPETLTFTILPNNKKDGSSSEEVELKISATDENGEEASLEISVNTVTLSTRVTKEGHIMVYPNPATDQLTVELNNTASVRSDYWITNIAGSQVANGVIYSGSNIINLDALPSGVYFLSLEIDSKLHIQKIIINKQ